MHTVDLPVMPEPDLPGLTASLRTARDLPTDAGHLSALVLAHGSMELRLFRPVPEDHQTPHDRDELYLIASGTATLLRWGAHSPWEEEELLADSADQIPMAAGDAAVVPAGSPHRFTGASADFAAWMVFWGPEGGEQP